MVLETFYNEDWDYVSCFHMFSDVCFCWSGLQSYVCQSTYDAMYVMASSYCQIMQ